MLPDEAGNFAGKIYTAIKGLPLAAIPFCVILKEIMAREKCMESIARIREMERLFDEVRAALESGKRIDELTEAICALESYYTGGQWMLDFRKDERGEWPSDLKRGILSEDAMYDLLTKIDRKRRKHMRKNFGAKPYCYPQPVFILAAYDANGVPCAMNAAWGGISEENEISMCISPEHKTTANILARGAFTVSMATAEYVVACDYVGIVSGNDVPDKFARAGFHAQQSEFVDAPLIEELPMALECRLIAYDPQSCRLVGEIVNVCAEESVLDAQGVIDVRKLDPITFDPVSCSYLRLGERVGQAFSDGAKIE